MTGAIDRWMDGYVRAWSTNAPDDVRALFTDSAAYRTAPWLEPATGHDAILAMWERTADEPDDHAFTWHLLGADGGRHFVQGRTTYADGRVYENLWVVDLDDDGRASGFTEWYMESESKPLGPNA